MIGAFALYPCVFFSMGDYSSCEDDYYDDYTDDDRDSLDGYRHLRFGGGFQNETAPSSKVKCLY